MNNIEFSSKQTEYIEIFNNYANERFLQLSEVQETLLSAMKYSFFAGGKPVPICVVWEGKVFSRLHLR